MSVCERLWSGRHLDNKMVSQPELFTAESVNSTKDAIRGSEMLRNALFRSAGYYVPETPPPPPPPVFEVVKIKIVRSHGPVKKVWRDNPVVARIIQLIARRYGLTAGDITGRLRTKDITVPRHLAMYLARKIEGVSYPNIGRQFGNRDHTTVISGVREIERLIARGDRKVIAAAKAVQKALGQ